MNNTIQFSYEKENYTLEYNRMAIKFLEQKGFDISKFESQPLTMLELAFTAAFLKNHKNIKNNIIEEIYDAIPNKIELSKALMGLISETYNSLLNPDNNDESNDNSKNIDWKIV